MPDNFSGKFFDFLRFYKIVSRYTIVLDYIEHKVYTRPTFIQC